MEFIIDKNNSDLFHYNKESYQLLKEKINFNLVEKKIYFSTKFRKRLLFDMSKYENNEIFTNYDIEHLINRYDINIPNINTYHENINKYSEKEKKYKNLLSNNINVKYIKEAFFFSSFTCCHNIITHIMFDFINQINYFYDILKNNEKISIIIEYIPHGTLKHKEHKLFLEKKTQFKYYEKNILKNIYLQEILKKFIKDIKLNNKIIFLTNVYEFKNIDENFLFVNKMHYINLQNIDNITWLPLISKFIYNKDYKLIPNLLNKIIIKNSPENINVHYKYHKKKFLILEKRINSSYFGEKRNIDIDVFHNIEKYCEKYCYENNLKLVIWDDNIIKNNSIYQQFELCNNAQIVIGFAGSFWLFNYALQNNTVVLIFDIFKCEISDFKRIISKSNLNLNYMNITFYTFHNILRNKHLKKYLIWGDDGSNNYLNILKTILENYNY